MRSATPRARSTESGSTGPAKEKPTRSEKATAAAGAMCVIDWNNTCAKPMECSRRWSNLCPDSISNLPHIKMCIGIKRYIQAMPGARDPQLENGHGVRGGNLLRRFDAGPGEVNVERPGVSPYPPRLEGDPHR